MPLLKVWPKHLLLKPSILITNLHPSQHMAGPHVPHVHEYGCTLYYFPVLAREPQSAPLKPALSALTS